MPSNRIPPPPLPPQDAALKPQFETPLGLVLWKALRDVWLWAEAEDGERRRMLFRPATDTTVERFAYARAETPELESALATFLRLSQTPDLVTEDALAEACMKVYAWAEERDLRMTSWCFAEAAAYADPKSPARANLAARTARRMLRDDRGALWHYRAYKLAAGTEDVGELIAALLGYGIMMKEAGRLTEAKRCFQRCARGAARKGRRPEAAAAHHELMTIAAERGEFLTVAYHTRGALHYYKRRAPQIPMLAHDFAFALIRKSYFSAALPLLSKLTPHVRDRVLQPVGLSTLAWTSAVVGDFAQFHDAERLALAQIVVYNRYAPAVFLHLAEGARALGDWEIAGRYARGAYELAETYGDAVMRSEAEVLQDEIARRSPPPPDELAPEQVRNLVEKLIKRLDRWSSPPRSKKTNQ